LASSGKGNEPVLTFVSGVIVMSFFTAGLFFVKFWYRTSDKFFLFFAAAFFMLSANQAITAFATLPLEERTNLYLLRLAAFLAIILGIAMKNRLASR
jgi:hypothetical protein